ncbi:MAG: hypothetical protein ABR510_07955 [Trueperaceae bacterium]
MRRVAVVVLVLVAVLRGAGYAQGVAIAAPPDRFVAPGSFATLVFRIEAPAAVDVEVSATVDAGWTVLRPPGRATLEAGRSTPIAVTLEVPSDAAAGARAEVRLVVEGPDGRSERAVILTVTERVDVGLQAPSEHTIGGDGFEVVVTNGGNVDERATLAFSRDGALLDLRELVLAPAAREIVRFEPTVEGLHLVVLTTERGAEVRRSVRVLRFGTGLDQPFALAGEVSAAIGTSGRRALVFGVKGAVSDFVTVDARLDAAAWARSYALAEGSAWSVRAGAGWRDPFGLALPADPGLAARWQGSTWGVAAHAGWLGDDRFGGSASVEWSAATTEVAAGVGFRAGSPTLALRAAVEPRPGTELLATAGLRGGAVDAALQLDVKEAQAASRFTVAGRDLAGVASRVDLGLRHRVADAELYADGTLPIGASAAWSGRVGFREAPITPLAGTVEVAAQAGTSESFARIGYRTDVGAGWRVGTTAGVRTDALGFGVTFDAALARTGADPIDLDARLDYRPATGRVGGRVGAQARFSTEPVDVALAFGWDLTDRDVAAGAVAAWSDGPWSVELDATVGLGYAGADLGGWRADVALSGAYAFDLRVPDGVAEAAGGRRSGVLEGRAATDAGEPLAGVVLSVGRFRAVTDDEGVYRLELVPGRYDVAVDVTTVPIAYRLTAATRAAVEVGLRTTTTFDVPVARTTALRGRVLEDRDGDGVADEPARPVVARVRVIDADGLGRTISVDATGGFELRGLPAGEARVEAFDLPLGASVVGEGARTVVLEPGAPTDVTILVRPVPAQVATFGGGALRVRSVVAEAARVPPGAAPLVRVQVAGDADGVVFEVGAERVPLERDGAGWIGRVPVPASSGAGVLPFVVVARAGEEVAERRDQLIVDPDAPLLEADGDGPVRAGSDLRVDVVAYFEAATVSADGPFGALDLLEGEPGRWSGVLAVPSDAPDSVAELAISALAGDGVVATTTYRFRVLAP